MWLKVLLLFSSSVLLHLSDAQERLQPLPTYFITAPRKVRPNQIVSISATLLRLEYNHVSFRVLIKRDDTEIASVFEKFDRPSTKLLQMKMPENSVKGNYTLRVEGSTNGGLSGLIFENETALEFDSKQVSLFIQTSQPSYKQGTYVSFRVVPLHRDLTQVHTSMNIYVVDANKATVRRWLNQQTNAGVLSKQFELTGGVPEGEWTIRVIALGHTYYKTFDVEENYGPRLSANVSMVPYILTNSFGLTGLVSCNQSKGMACEGNCSITLRIQDRNNPGAPGEPTIVHHLPYFYFRTDFLFTREEMEKAAGGNLAGKQLRVEGKVIDYFQMDSSTGWQISYVYSADIKLTWLGDEYRTFKPEMPFTVYLVAAQQDGTLLTSDRRRVTIIETRRRLNGNTYNAPYKEMQFSPGSSVLPVQVLPALNDELITLEARYEDEQTRVKVQAFRHLSPSQSYIHVISSTTKPEVNEYMIFTVKTNTFVDIVYYQIVSAGSIIISDYLEMESNQKTFSVAMSKDMAPSARILAYFIHPDTGEVIADGLNFFVKGTTQNKVKVTINRGKDFSGKTVEIQATADPGAFVCLSATEYFMYSLGINSGITEDMVTDELFSYDSHANSTFSHHWRIDDHHRETVYFPSPSYAVDANKTFAFAGLHVFTDADLVEVQHNCNFTLGFLPCWDGTCYRNHTRCNGVVDCKRDGGDEFGCPKEDVIPHFRDIQYYRTKHTGKLLFGTSWAWKDAYTKPDGRIDIKVNVPTYPGSWVVHAFSMSRTKGIGFLDEPAWFDGVRPFYMICESAKRVRAGEQVGVRCTIFNFWDTEVEALVTLHSSPDYDFVIVDYGGQVNSYSPRTGTGEMQTLIVIKQGESRFVHFPVLPKKMGYVEVTISAITFIGMETKKVTFNVDHSGVTNYYNTPNVLDLLTTGSIALPELNISVPAEFIEPNTAYHLYVPGSQKSSISVVGDIVGPGLFEPGFLDAEMLLREPWAAGEQTMFGFAYTMYMLKFLKDTNQLSASQLEETLDGLNLGLQEVMAYYREEGDMAHFLAFEDHSPPSLWASAFFVGTLHDAMVLMTQWVNHIYIDVDQLNKVALWIVEQQNTTDGPLKGCFADPGPIYDRKMASNVTVDGMEENITLTAHVLIALTKLTQLTATGEARRKVDDARKLARDYLSLKIDSIQDPYQMAIVTYALTVAESIRRSNAYQKLKSMKTDAEYYYWSAVPIPVNPSSTVNTIEYLDARIPADNEAVAVEATSYALLCYLLNGERDEAGLIMKWLQTQRNTIGGFASTADSIVALQALILYADQDTDRNLYNMQVFISVRNFTSTLTFTRENYNVMQRVELPVAFGSVKVTAQGTGLALLQLETQVNVEYANLLRKPPVYAYSVALNNINFHGRNLSIFEADACAWWNRTHITPRSGLSVMEVQLPSGYEVFNPHLIKLAGSGKYHNLKNAEFYDQKIVYYFNYLDGNETCIHFLAHRWQPVANHTREHMIRVFDYYEPANYNTSMYTVLGLHKLDVCQVCASWQCSYCPFYNSGLSVQYSAFLMMLCTLLVSVKLNFVNYWIK